MNYFVLCWHPIFYLFPTIWSQLWPKKDSFMSFFFFFSGFFLCRRPTLWSTCPSTQWWSTSSPSSRLRGASPPPSPSASPSSERPLTSDPTPRKVLEPAAGGACEAPAPSATLHKAYISIMTADKSAQSNLAASIHPSISRLSERKREDKMEHSDIFVNVTKTLDVGSSSGECLASERVSTFVSVM